MFIELPLTEIDGITYTDCIECDGTGEAEDIVAEGRTSIGAYYPVTEVSDCPYCENGLVVY